MAFSTGKEATTIHEILDLVKPLNPHASSTAHLGNQDRLMTGDRTPLCYYGNLLVYTPVTGDPMQVHAAILFPTERH